MDKYITQLIEQFQESAKNVGKPSVRAKDFDLDNELEEEDFIYVEQYIYGTPKPLSEIFGIEKICLPDDEKLTDEQVDILANEAEKLWNAYHFYPDFPKTLPARLRYRKLREYWDDKQVFVGVGEIHVEFCDYEEENCPFPGYCKTCEEIARQMEYDELTNTGDSKNFDFDIKDLLPTPEEAKQHYRSVKKQEIKEKLINQNTENRISGIHNYCDRWCEKCSFTCRCGSYSLEKDIYTCDEDKDIRNEVFWENLSLMFEVTMELLDEKMKELGIVLEDNDEVQELLSDDENEKHPIEQLSLNYTDSVHEWINANDQQVEFLLSDSKPHNNKIDYKEGLETILWYHVFISVKLHRALFGYRKQEMDEFSQNDMNGSAKITLIVIERSIGAWGVLLQVLTQFEDDVFTFIKNLTELQRKVRLMFPDAESFIRPGFDE
ncbi:MAG: hypothetical protein ABIJ97_03590 [Bacteroidota bacterium]